MKRLTSLAILVALTLVLDRGFNQSQATIRLADEWVDAKGWITRSSAKVARTLYGFSGA